MTADRKVCPKCQQLFPTDPARRKHQRDTHGEIARGARPAGESKMTPTQLKERKRVLMREARRRVRESKTTQLEVAEAHVPAPLEAEFDEHNFRL